LDLPDKYKTYIEFFLFFISLQIGLHSMLYFANIDFKSSKNILELQHIEHTLNPVDFIVIHPSPSKYPQMKDDLNSSGISGK